MKYKEEVDKYFGNVTMKEFKEIREHAITMAGHNAYVGPSNEVEESPLISTDAAILDSIFKKIKQKIESTKNERDQLGMVQQLAKMAGYGVTKKMQTKGKTYRWDLKK